MIEINSRVCIAKQRQGRAQQRPYPYEWKHEEIPHVIPLSSPSHYIYAHGYTDCKLLLILLLSLALLFRSEKGEKGIRSFFYPDDDQKTRRELAKLTLR